ncbi:MAG: transcription elongation GreA/GreB family factor [Bacteroidia bacterium]|jgi:transcription elongation GreA/GreB family factor
MASMNKSEIHAACMVKQQTKLAELQNARNKVQESIVGEDNSTAGNKFETARAMGQEELDRLNQTMNIAIRELTLLSNISPDKPCDSVQLGALITTDKKMMYLCVGLGKIEIGKDIVFAISTSSPIGQQLMGAEKGTEVVFGGKKEKIISVA